MNATAAKPATTPIPVQLSETEFSAFILPYLSMPKRGPKCKLGYYRVFNLILRVLYTGMQWKCLPVPTEPDGKPAIHYTTIDKVFAKWTDDGSLWQAFVASVRHLAAAQQLDLSVLHGDGSNTVAKKGGMALGIRGTNTRTPISAAQNRSTFLGLPEKLTGTGRPLGDFATKESPGAVGREQLPAGAGCGSACRSARRSVPTGFRPHLLFPRICDRVVWVQRCQSLAVAWRASDSTHWPVPSWWCQDLH